MPWWRDPISLWPRKTERTAISRPPAIRTMSLSPSRRLSTSVGLGSPHLFSFGMTTSMATTNSADLHGSGRQSAFIFDLDGTLVDSVYPHVLSCRTALRSGGTELASWPLL